MLDHGELVECGSHTELLTKNGHYAKYYTTQMGAQEAVTAEDNAVRAHVCLCACSCACACACRCGCACVRGGVLVCI